MKVAIVTDRIYPFYTGGYEYYLYRIALKLSEDCEVTVFTSLDSNVSKSAGKVRFIGFSEFQKYTNKKGEHSFSGVLKYTFSTLLNHRLINDPDMVIVNSIPYVGVPFLMKRIRKRSKVAVIFYEAWYNYPNMGFLNSIKRGILRNRIKKIIELSDNLLSISEPTTHSLMEHYGAKDVFTSPLGVDLKFIDEIQQSKEKFDIVYLGRLAAIKHVEDILSSVELLKDKGIPISVAIIGDGPMRNILENISDKKDLRREVKFLGKISDIEKYSILKSSKIFVMPSEREGFSIATLEAMACGCVPIVAIPGFPELFGVSHFVRNDWNGLYFNVGEVSHLAFQIEKLLSDAEYYSKMKENALKDSKDYDWEIVLNQLKKFLKNVCHADN